MSVEELNNVWGKSVKKAQLQLIKQQVKNVQEATLIIDREAKKEIPVDTGYLRASQKQKVQLFEDCIKGYNYNTSEYAPFVHQGTGIYALEGDGRKTPWKYHVKAGKYKGWHITRGQVAAPFIRNAQLQNIDKIQRALRGEL